MFDVGTSKKTLQSLSSDILDIRQDLTEVITNNDSKLTLVADKLDSIDRKIQDIHTELSSSRNGSLLWKISDFTNLLARAKINKNLCVCSDFLYTGVYGYKLQFRAYPNGIGIGQDTHLSIYVVLYKTEHDLLMHWPFKQKVKVKLIDMNETASNRHHQVVTIGPERQSSSFVRPVHNHNPGWGFPNFISHDALQTFPYLQENCLFLKLLVQPYDAMDIHKQTYE